MKLESRVAARRDRMSQGSYILIGYRLLAQLPLGLGGQASATAFKFMRRTSRLV